MKTLLVGLVLTILHVGAVTGAVRPEGEVQLFNGKDLDGWEVVGTGKADARASWTIRDGVLRCSGEPYGYIRTETPYADYKLTVEWRFVKAGNTGVLLHTQGEDKVWPRSIEFQGQHQSQGDVYLIGGTSCAEQADKSKRKVEKKGPHNEKPVGEWNVYEITCRGEVMEGYVNGKLMNRLTGCTVTEGWIGFQSEGAVWELRKATLNPLVDHPPE